VYKADADGARRVYISQPIGKPLRLYPSDKFATKSRIDSPMMRFSPDGRNILLFFNNGEEKRWLLPYPAERGEPRQVLANLRESPFTPSFDWFPDSRHIAVGLPVISGGPINLWQADVFGSGVYPLTASPSSQFQPAVSPGGKTILFTEGSSDYDLAYVTLADGKTEKVLSTARDEFQPAWAHESLSFAYVTNINGAPEIWLHGEDGAARPVVTSEDFVPERIDFFMNPTPFPKADRVIYTAKGSSSRVAYLWISSTTGGAPTRVTNSADANEYAGSLSPDGRQAIYLSLKGSRSSLMKVRTSGQSTPVLVREDVDSVLPNWSPDGNWITTKINGKWNLISPDGMQQRSLGDVDADYLAFSVDGSRLYSIHKDSGKDRQVLFYIPVTGSKETVVGEVSKDFRPVSPLNPGFRLSVCPDGATALFTVGKYRANIWSFEGFKPSS
jgi:Tol biopolymer transport system component